MKSLKRISSRIFIGIFTGTIIVFSISSIIDFFYTKNVIQELIKNNVKYSFSASYNKLNTKIIPIINNAENTAYYLSSFELNNNEVLAIQNKNRNEFKNILTCSITQFYKNQDKFYTQYISDDTIITELNKNIILCDLPELTTNKTSNTKYPINISLRNDTLSFCYYYYSALKNICIQYDFKLQEFIEILDSQSDLLPSRHYIFDEHNEALRSSTKKISNTLEDIQRKEIKLIHNLIENGAEGLYTPTYLDYDRAIYLSSIEGTKITIASTIFIDKIIYRFRRFVVISYTIGLIAIILLAYILQRIIVRITRPIEELTDISKKIQAGSLNTIIPEYYKDGETAQLSDTLRTVQGRMKRYVSDLNSTLKEKRAMEHELKIANKIQFDMIPEPDRALTELPEIDLYAKMVPAKGVAGDFYDYFFLDDKNLFFVIGDVSGKGIHAALFMVKALTLIKASAKKLTNPSLVFNEVNEQLCHKNDEGMFVTAISGIINIITGETILCDAGHNVPIFSINGKNFKYTNINKGMPLGIMPEKIYKETKIQLRKKDTLLFYTDGFPECFGIKDKILGEDALISAISEKTDAELSSLSTILWRVLKEFRQETPASDDTTLLILRFFGRN